MASNDTQATGQRATISEIIRDRTAIDEALRQAVREALWRHKQLGQSVVIWRDGQIVSIPPEEIDVGNPNAQPPGVTEPSAA